MTRGWKIGLGLAAFVLGLNVILALLHGVTGGTPGGRRSSSYATGPDGVAAYATLLARNGHAVSRLHRNPAEAQPAPNATVVLLDADGPVPKADAVALQRFVTGGGRLLVGGAAGPWLRRIVPAAPAWSPTAPRTLRRIAPAPEIANVDRLETSGYGSWASGSALPAIGDGERALFDVVEVGRGRALLLADTRPLQNRALDHADDAAFGLALAGAPSRPVIFLESYHGYGGASSGLGAIPGRWWDAFAVLAVAAAVLMLASGRRFGPPQQAERSLSPARREYVESLGGVLARSRKREQAVAPVLRHIRRRLSERSGLAAAATDAEIRAAAIAVGVATDDADVLLRKPVGDADVLAVGRVLARVEGESRP